MDPSAFHGLYIPVSPSSLQGDSEYILSRYVDASQLDGSANDGFYSHVDVEGASAGVDVDALDKPFAIEDLELGSLLGTGVAGEQLQHHLTDHTDLVHSYYHPHQLENHAPIDPVNVSYPNPVRPHQHQHTPQASTSASSSSSSSLVNLHHLNKSHLPPTPTSTISNYEPSQQQSHLSYQSQSQIPVLHHHQQQQHDASQVDDSDPYNLLAASGPAGNSSTNSNPGHEYPSRPPPYTPFPDLPQQSAVNAVQDTEPLYVNAKQYHRIVKRRNARARLAELHRLSNQRKVRLASSAYQ
jgi:hypothetical protein